MLSYTPFFNFADIWTFLKLFMEYKVHEQTCKMQAGCRNVVELHGTNSLVTCMTCSFSIPRMTFQVKRRCFYTSTSFSPEETGRTKSCNGDFSQWADDEAGWWCGAGARTGGKLQVGGWVRARGSRHAIMNMMGEVMDHIWHCWPGQGWLFLISEITTPDQGWP